MKTIYRSLFYLCLLLLSVASYAEDNSPELNTSTSDEQPYTAALPPVAHMPKISLNKATVRELIKVKGIKPNNAKTLVRYRKKHGDFKSVDEISYVKGFKRMKPQTLKQIEAQLTL